MPKTKKSPSAISAKPLRVVELFAGVGGFRIGLEKISGKPFEIAWSNQYEPGSSKQWASWVYESRWLDTDKSKHSNKLVEDAIASGEVPDHDVLVGGFPCQDYSVAKPNNQSKGIEGKKGVLWWSIYQIAEKHRPSYLILENVDRLTKSPANQRGRDFAVMLRCLQMLGYHVEWRVINAADYGMPQRRRRVFIVGYHKDTPLGKLAGKSSPKDILLREGILAKAFPVQSTKPGNTEVLDDDDSAPAKGGQSLLPFFEEETAIKSFDLKGAPHEVSESHSLPFLNSGVSLALDDKSSVHMAHFFPVHSGERVLLGDLLSPENEVDDSYRIPEAALKSWIRQKSGKREMRANYQTTIDRAFDLLGLKGGDARRTDAKLRGTLARALAKHWKANSRKPLELSLPDISKPLSLPWSVIQETRFEYEFAEGSLPIPDPLERPMRTIITSEGGAAPSRFKHLVCCECAKRWKKDRKSIRHDCLEVGNLRRLTPEELEAGNMFPRGHTKVVNVEGEQVEVPAGKRAFFMGNALVCGVITRIGKSLVSSL